MIFKQLGAACLFAHVYVKPKAQVRPIAARCGLLPRVHGSALFTRGETQALCTATLGSTAAAQFNESLSAEHDDSAQSFYLQYFFPPSSVGETGRMGAPGRRELGHGKLAERALAPAVAAAAAGDAFPYVVRIESHITESNGSSSMASVCGGTLALLVRALCSHGRHIADVLCPVKDDTLGCLLRRMRACQ